MKLTHGLILLVVFSCTSATKLRKRPNATKARPYWYPEVCFDYPNEDFFPHELACDMYWECQADGTAEERWCNEGEVFDYEYLTCWDEGICWMDAPEEVDSECPLNSNNLIILPGETCENYYICNNGKPILMWCAKGMHFNMAQQYCESPARAGCDVSEKLSLKISHFQIKLFLGNGN